jgi:hypothetical protein
MAMLLITDEQLSTELNKISGKVVDIKRGRGSIHEVPQGLRQVIAEEAINGTPAKELSEQFGISTSSISAYKNGATSTASYNTPDNQLAKANDDVRENIASHARSRLMMALEEITPDKIAGAKIKDIAGIAKDMSAVVKNMEPQGPQVQQNTQVVVYRPRTRDEDEFEVITVNE